MSSLLESYLDVLYGQEILYRLPDVIQEKCEGCVVESLFLQDHTCFLLAKRVQLDLHIEDVL